MLRQFVTGKPSELDEAIAKCLTVMNCHDPGTDEYEAALSALIKLEEAKAREPKFRVSPDVLFSGGVTLASVLLMIGYERTNVIASKAMTMIKRPNLP